MYFSEGPSPTPRPICNLPTAGFDYLSYLFAALQTLPRVNRDHLFYFHFVRQTVNDQG